MQDSDNDESSFTDTEPVIEVESVATLEDDDKLEPFSAIHSPPPPSKKSKKIVETNDESNKESDDESTNNDKPRLRSMPRSLRVVMKNHSDSKILRKKIAKLIQERYNIGKPTEKRMKRFDKCLSRALDKGLNDIGDIKQSKKSGHFSLIQPNPSDTTPAPKSKTIAPVVSLPSVSFPSASTVVETGPKFTHKWQYDDNGFHDYDKEASKEVEAAYQDYLKSPGCWDVRAVKSGKWEYQVDFPNMKQTNIQHEKHTQRSIRRVNIS